MATPGSALESDFSQRMDAMSTAMPRTTTTFAALLVAFVLGACAPTHEWASPGIGASARDADLRQCMSIGAGMAAESSWHERRRVERDAWFARTRPDRAFANARLHQLQMLESLDRQRHADACMAAHGYRLVPLDP